MFRKRKAYITLERSSIDIDGETKECIDSFGIKIREYGKCHTLDDLDLSNKHEFIVFLAEAKRKKLKAVEFSVEEASIRRVITVPRWAYQELIDQMWMYL